MGSYRSLGCRVAALVLLTSFQGTGWPVCGAGEPPPVPTVADVSYGPHPRQVMHFWKAPSATADRPAPLLFYVHGGGWQGGDRLGGLARQLPRFLDAGISVASVEYRFISDAMAAKIDPPVRAPLEDAARALQTVRSKAAEWQVDPHRIAGSGASAGGCTCLWLAFHDDMADPASDDPVARQSTRLCAVAVEGAQTTLDPVRMKEWTPNSRYGGHAFGFMDSPEARDARFADFLAARDRILTTIERYSPESHVSADDPPVYLSFWEPPSPREPSRDPTHTANFGLLLAERLDKAGVPYELAYPGAQAPRHATALDFLVAAFGSDHSRLAELDALWAEVDRAVREGDFEAYAACCHPEGVLVSERKGLSQPLSAALARWKAEFKATREGRMTADVETRFTRRLGDATTAHESGMFRYTSQTEGKEPQTDFVPFDALLVKRDGRWLILMEHQKAHTSQEEWEKLAPTPIRGRDRSP
jgi:uncharacterized protein (TIGR02246 family)